MTKHAIKGKNSIFCFFNEFCVDVVDHVVWSERIIFNQNKTSTGNVLMCDFVLTFWWDTDTHPTPTDCMPGTCVSGYTPHQSTRTPSRSAYRDTR